MPKYLVFPLGEPIEKYPGQCTKGPRGAPARKRLRMGFRLLREALEKIPELIKVIEQPESAMAWIETAEDVAPILVALNLGFVAYLEERRFPVGAKHLFLVKASGWNAAGTQARITEILQRKLDAEVGQESHTYWIPDDPASRWLPGPERHHRSWMTQLTRLEEVLTSYGISAELGIWRKPEVVFSSKFSKHS